MRFDKNKGLSLACDKEKHHAYRSLPGQIDWLQSRTQFHSCNEFSRCASCAAGPLISDAKRVNKLVRTIRAGYQDQTVRLLFWPLKGKPRIAGYPDAAFQNNKPDKSSQRAHAILLVPPEFPGKVMALVRLLIMEARKLKRLVLPRLLLNFMLFSNVLALV